MFQRPEEATQLIYIYGSQEMAERQISWREDREVWGNEEKCHSLKTEGLSRSFWPNRVLLHRKAHVERWVGMVAKPAWGHVPDLPIFSLDNDFYSLNLLLLSCEMGKGTRAHPIPRAVGKIKSSVI